MNSRNGVYIKFKLNSARCPKILNDVVSDTILQTITQS